MKELNEFVNCEHFKMAGIKAIINMVARNCFVATIDLIDAYNSVSIISRLFQKFLILNGKINCTLLHAFQMVLGLAQENSLN